MLSTIKLNRPDTLWLIKLVDQEIFGSVCVLVLWADVIVMQHCPLGPLTIHTLDFTLCDKTAGEDIQDMVRRLHLRLCWHPGEARIVLLKRIICKEDMMMNAF